MQPGDLTFCTYRGHAHTLARGVPVEQVLGELMRRDNGLMRGKGGSMHLTSSRARRDGLLRHHRRASADRQRRRLAAQYRGTSEVAVCFFGDGTTNIGAFHEALNFAAVWKLPVVFVCENNLYMEYTPIGDVTAVEHPAADRAAAYGLERSSSTATTPTWSIAPRMQAYRPGARRRRPVADRGLTYRHSGHSRADPAKYRPEGELEKWMERDPIMIYRERLKQFGVGDEAIAEDRRPTSKRDVDEATEAARRRRCRRSIARPTTSGPTEAAAWRN